MEYQEAINDLLEYIGNGEYNGDNPPIYLKTAQLAIESLQSMRWIPVAERLPNDNDNRFYMVVQENHESDVPNYYQYDEELGFGVWRDYYDRQTLGFLDSEFITLDELGEEKVLAWKQIPAYEI